MSPDTSAWPQEGDTVWTPDSTVSVRMLQDLARVVDQAGASGAALVRAARISPEQICAPEGRLKCAELYRACELALELTRDPALGLHWAEHLDDQSCGLVFQLVIHAANLRQGLESLFRFGRLLCDVWSYELYECQEEVALQVKGATRVPLHMEHFRSELLVFGFLRILRAYGIRTTLPRVHFAYSAPSYCPEYARVFTGNILFDQSFTGIVFPRALLNTPSPYLDGDLHEVLGVLARRRLWHLTQRKSYAAQVRDYLIRHGEAHRVGMQQAAQAVGLSERSLRRRLNAEHTTYSTVAEEARKILAQHFLRDEQRTIQETAHALGFASSANFHHAFRRWTGTTLRQLPRILSSVNEHRREYRSMGRLTSNGPYKRSLEWRRSQAWHRASLL